MSFTPLRSKYKQIQLLFFPTVTTQAASSITSTTVTGNGTVISDGGSADTVRGFVYSTSTINPTLSDSVITSGSGAGVYTASITGLSSSTLYYYRAYATNAIGTNYGDSVIFTTSAGVATSYQATFMMMGMGM